MAHIVTATLSSKAQITLPKEVRETLGLKSAGELVGFMVDPDSHRVELTRMRVTPEEPDFTEAEYRKLLGIAKRKGKTFRTGSQLIKHLRKL